MNQESRIMNGFLRKTLIATLFLGGFLLFNTPAAQAQNVNFNGDVIISGDWDSFTTVTAKSDCALDSLLVDASDFTVSVPSGSSCIFETSAGTFVSSGSHITSCGPPIRITITGLAQSIEITPTDSACVTPASPGSSIINLPPGIPANIISTATASNVTLRWNDPADQDLASIEVWRNNCAGGGVNQLLSTVAKGIRVYTDTGNIQPSATCVYMLIAKDTENNKTASQEVSVVIPAIQQTFPVTVCGNGSCESGETSTSCAVDCVIAKPNLVLTLTTQLKQASPAASAAPVSSIVLALTASIFLFGAFLIHAHTGAENGPSGFFAIFPLLFTSSSNSYMYLRKCGPDKCKGAHFTRHKILKQFTRAGFAAMAVAGIFKLVLIVALASFLPGSQDLQAEVLNAHVGDTITSILTVRNTGTVSASNAIIRLPTPDGVKISNLLMNDAVSTADLNTGISIAAIAPNDAIVISADYSVLSSALNIGAISFKGQATSAETASQVFESTAATLAVSAQLPTAPIKLPKLPTPPTPPIPPIPPTPPTEEPEPFVEQKSPVGAGSEMVAETPVIESIIESELALVPSSVAETAQQPSRGSSLQSITSADISQFTENFENKLTKELKNAAKQGVVAGNIKVDFNVGGLLAEISPGIFIQKGFVPVVFSVQVVVPEITRLIRVIVESDPQIFTFIPTKSIEEYVIPVNLAMGTHKVAVQAIDSAGELITLANASFQVSLPACFDGLDNDNDGLKDEQDPGCASRDDNDEFQAVARIVSFIAPEIVTRTVEKATTSVVQTKTYQVLDKQVLNNPQVEEATIKIAAPVIVATAAANAGAAINFASLLVYLQGFMTQPLLLFTRRKRKQWGVVYSSLTKMPVDLALVRLFSVENNKLIQTRVTDKQGRYLFLANPGSYVMKVQKPGFIFPSALLKDKNSDFDFAEIYHGDPIQVQALSTTLTPVIPVDPIEKVETPKDIIRHQRKRKLQKTVAWTGPMFAIASVAINPTLTTTALLVFQFGLLGLFKRLSQGKAPKSWGSVADKQTGQPITFAVARIFDAQFNKLLETQITDKNGRYAFLVGKGIFYITVQKSGYSQYKSPLLDLTKQGVSDIIKQDIRLEKGSEMVSTTTSTPNGNNRKKNGNGHA